ncbi:MAG: ribonuclease Z, partial [Deltaproteobacteria bacterium]|nr:ribonuclease Z [Deltaproteobacteria bacterium]
MKPLFQYEFVNQPFNDPGLYIRLNDEPHALLFDAGEISHFPARKLLKISHVFVTHTHIDHFIGFDHLLRLMLARNKNLSIFGPRGIISHVAGKVKGYTWDLVNSYPFSIYVTEMGVRTCRTARFVCRERFRQEPVGSERLAAVIDEQPHYCVSAVRLDHRIPSIAYGLQERFHININKDRLTAMGLPAGKWLRQFKDALWAGQPDDAS